MGAALQERLGLARRLELAIEQGLLHLHYQPRVALASETLRGAEALLRWHDAEFGEVSPAQFIPIAEERGLIGPLGDWVIRSEEHTSALQSLMRISYAVFCLKK